jgi:hypothetical protein
MKKLLLIALTGLLMAGATAPALALGPVDLEAELPVYTKYVWRGMNLVDEAVLQPSIEVGLFGFEVAVWGNMYLTDIYNEAGQFSEVDYTLGYELELAIIELEAGFLHYSYPKHHFDDTTEFYLGAEVNVLLSPSLMVYQDIDKFKGAYWAASIGHGFGLGETMQLDLTGGLGLGSKSFISGYYGGILSVPDTDLDASMTDFFVRAEVPFSPIPFLSIVPSMTYTSLLGDAEKALDNDEMLYFGKKENVVWGLAAGFSF